MVFLGTLGYLAHKYHKLTHPDFLSKELTINDAKQKQLAIIHDLRDKGIKVSSDDNNTNEGLDLYGSPRTIDGLLSIWKHESTSFSFFDQKKYKQEKLKWSIINLMARRGEWLRSENMLFKIIGKNKGVDIYVETDQGVFNHIYMNKQANKMQ